MAEQARSRSLLRRTARNAVARTTSLVEDQVTSTARGVVDDVEPYLIEHTVPRIVESLVPDLVERIVPAVLDGVSEHVATVTVPQVVEQATPQLADELLPELLDRLRPYLEEALAPALIDAITPRVAEVTAPQVMDALLPKIRAEVVPVLLDDIVDDPRVRDLIRQQSMGLVLDGFETFRRLLAAGDDRVEDVGRRLRRGQQSADGWPVPAGRTRSHAGIVTRGVGYLIDLGIVTFLASQGLAAVLGIVDAVTGSVPSWLAVAATAAAVGVGPAYFSLGWWMLGRTVGSAVAGYEVCRTDGRRPHLPQAVVRGCVTLPLVLLWMVGMAHSTGDPARRGWLDLLTRTRTPYRARGG
jgi:hypothetical protein